MIERKKVCVVGLGYVGLPTSVFLAGAGMEVLGVDSDPRVVEEVNAGRTDLVEPELGKRLKEVVDRGRLMAASDPVPADVFILAVPTPFKEDHKPDMSHVQAAARAIAPHLCPENLVLLESTVPPGTTDQMVAWILEERPDLRADDGRVAAFFAAHCPERVLPGRILAELAENDRVVGGVDRESRTAALHFYQGFVRGECAGTDARTAELTKLAENAFRDVNIAFANELSMIAERLAVDVWELIDLANRHPRVDILRPGAGVGGHCIAVDPWFIVDAAPDQCRLIRAARETNRTKTDWVVQEVTTLVNRSRVRGRIVCFGLTYKANVEDVRESPALEVAADLARRFPGRVAAIDPHVGVLPETAQRSGLELIWTSSLGPGDGVVVGLVPHSEFGLVDRPRHVVTMDFSGVWG